MVARDVARPRPPVSATTLFTVGLTETFGWRMRHAGPWRLWLKGHLAGEGDRGAIAALSALPPTVDLAAASRLAGALRGQFALVAERAETLVAVVDQVRSIPLVYGRRGDTLFLDQDGHRLQRALGLAPADSDPDAALAIALAGYTIGNDTLFREVRQLGPGQFLLARADGQIELGRHQRYQPYQPAAGSRAELKRALKEVIEASLHRLMAMADGRPIAIPLSAGCDSRLIASGLKTLGYRNVLTFAYGLPGNHDAETSRSIARQLGFNWRFVPFTARLMRAAYESADYAAFRRSCDSLTGVHFPQDYLALVTLQRDGYLPPDALIVNGQSGDFITGNHVPDALATPRHDLNASAREKHVIDALIARHFKQWAILATPGNLARIRAMLRREIAAIGGMPADAAGDHGIFEWCEFQDRQSKYVLNGQRLYEYLGFDWHLPLWDDAWLEFWSRVPLEAKLRQNLYREVLLEADFSAAWRGIPINAKTVRPRWMGPVRAGLKALHVAAEQRRWHAFERRYLQYWMDNICSYAPQSYWPVATDHRRPHSGIAYHIEAYLCGKGLGLDGLPLEGRIG